MVSGNTHYHYLRADVGRDRVPSPGEAGPTHTIPHVGIPDWQRMKGNVVDMKRTEEELITLVDEVCDLIEENVDWYNWTAETREQYQDMLLQRIKNELSVRGS